MKNKIISICLVALLFVANPGLIFAEEINTTPLENNSEVEVLQLENENIEQAEDINLEQEENIEKKQNPEQDDTFAKNNTTPQNPEESIEENLTSNINAFSLNVNNPETITVNLNIRYNDSIVFSDSVDVIKDGTTTILDNTNTIREIFTDSALGILNQADISSDDFSISNLAYYSSFDSFLINCLQVKISNGNITDACYSWQYVVNDSYPFVGVDKYDLNDGDDLYFYFGNPRIIELSTTTIFVGQSVTATAQKYDYKNNIYVPLTGYVIGLTQPDPNNPWSPTVLSATSSNELGQVIFNINLAGSYGIGLESDYYYPVYNVDVLGNPTNTPTTTATTSPSSNSGGGGSNNNSDKKIDIEKAIQFLISHQKTNGSFGADLYTDWATIALFITDESQAKNLVKNYLKSDKISGSAATDFQRRAMALMGAGLNPYSGTDVNYITKILDTFDGNQFGETGLINDDIFALFPLLNAGYDSNDQEIKKAVAFLISKQSSSGSWENVDLTAAAIQALSLVKDLPEVNSAISKARTYLKNQQQNDGGFGNTFATLWVMQSISALGEEVDSWTKGNENPLTYIASEQAEDGGLNEELDFNSRIWATSYLLPAYYEKTWDDILKNFPKEIENTNSDSVDNSGSGGGSGGSSSEILETEFDVNSTSTQMSPLENLANQQNILPENGEQLMADLEKIVSGEMTAEQLAEKIVSEQNVNLAANVIDSVNNEGSISFIVNSIKKIIDKTVAEIITLLGGIFSLFNF